MPEYATQAISDCQPKPQAFFGARLMAVETFELLEYHLLLVFRNARSAIPYFQAQLPAGYPLSLVDTIVWAPIEGLIFDNYTINGLLKPTVASFKPTQYTVTLYSIDGCNAQDRILVRVDNEPNIYIPNVFSPGDQNGDNDIVYIFAKDTQVRQIKSFSIFDRWGERVFEDFNFQPNDPAHGWDGHFRGDLLNPAVFVYVAEIELIDGRLLLYKGDVTLVK